MDMKLKTNSNANLNKILSKVTMCYSLRNWNIDYTRALKLFGRLGALAKRGKCSLLPIELEKRTDGTLGWA